MNIPASSPGIPSRPGASLRGCNSESAELACLPCKPEPALGGQDGRVPPSAKQRRCRPAHGPQMDYAGRPDSPVPPGDLLHPRDGRRDRRDFGVGPVALALFPDYPPRLRFLGALHVLHAPLGPICQVGVRSHPPAPVSTPVAPRAASPLAGGGLLLGLWTRG